MTVSVRLTYGQESEVTGYQAQRMRAAYEDFRGELPVLDHV
nr:hypothetical protein [uncultured Porphyromonas sp.]